MSFDVDLIDYTTKITVEVDPHSEGGNFVLGGNELAELNITYNYSKYYYDSIDKEKGLDWLDGKKAEDTVETLRNAVEELGIKQDEDYWASTPGNAGYALSKLLDWAKQYPQGIWKVS